MTGYAFDALRVQSVSPVQIRKERVRGCETPEKIAESLGDKAKAIAISTAQYSGTVTITFKDVIQLPTIQELVEDYNPWGTTHPPHIRRAAHQTVMTWANATHLGATIKAHGVDLKDPLSLADDQNPPLRTFNAVPTQFSPTATILNAYAAAISNATTRATQHHGTIGIAGGMFDVFEIVELLKLAPSLTLGAMQNYDTELLWVCPETTDSSLINELDKIVQTRAGDKFKYDVSVRARRQQCKSCYGQTHTNGKCGGPACGLCGDRMCTRTFDSKAKCKNPPKCGLCDDPSEAPHKPIECPLANGVRYDLRPSTRLANATTINKAARYSGITKPSLRKTGVAKRDKTFEEAVRPRDTTNRANAAPPAQLTAISRAHVQALLTGLATPGVLPPLTTTAQKLEAAEALIDAAQITAAEELPSENTVAEEKLIAELELKLTVARNALAQKRDAAAAAMRERHKTMAAALHGLQALFVPTQTSRPPDTMRESAETIVIRTKASQLAVTDLASRVKALVLNTLAPLPAPPPRAMHQPMVFTIQSEPPAAAHPPQPTVVPTDAPPPQH
jgi:hypothetical protein